MLACATQKTIADQPTNGNLFLPVPDTDFRDFLDEVDKLARFAPETITAIEALCPRKCRNSSLSRPKPRLNTERRTLNTPGRKDLFGQALDRSRFHRDLLWDDDCSILS
jgi:hypothetical protein